MSRVAAHSTNCAADTAVAAAELDLAAALAHLTTLAARAVALPMAAAPVAVRPMVMGALAQVAAPTIAVLTMVRAQRTVAAQI